MCFCNRPSKVFYQGSLLHVNDDDGTATELLSKFRNGRTDGDQTTFNGSSCGRSQARQPASVMEDRQVGLQDAEQLQMPSVMHVVPYADWTSEWSECVLSSVGLASEWVSDA
jgi:hypothetical protein